VKRALALLSWPAVLLLALAVRLPATTAALPYISYVDEGNFLHPAADLVASGGWDPRWYMYPSLPVTAVVAAARLYSPLDHAVHGRSLQQAVRRADTRTYDFLEPVDFLLLARALSLLASLGVVAVTGAVAHRLAGPHAGLLAGFAAALVPALAIRGGIATIDPYAALWAVACLGFAHRLDATDATARPGATALAAGAMAGLAFASKYPAVLVALAALPAILFAPRPWRRRLALLLLLAAGVAGGAALAMPALLAHPGEVAAAIRQQGKLYGEIPSPSYWRQAVARAEWDLPFAHPELGWPYLALAAAGVAVALRRRDTARTAAGWLLYAAAALALYSRYSFQPFRNLLPLVPVTCLAAAVLCARLRERSARPAWVDAAAFAAVAALFAPPLAGYVQERLRCADSRAETAAWLAAHAAEGGVVLVATELAFLPGELARLPARVEPWDSWRRAALWGKTRFAVTGELTAPDGSPRLDAATRRMLLARFRLRARFGEEPTPPLPGWWRGNRQRIYVLERKSPGD
jgi:4-amino-4-deoxy-L-arabinose transferase-like glycosyltransferase